jgi:ribonucleotide reductase alpha subunit/intein/homing endonuclease
MTTRWEIRVDEANPEEEIPLTENGRIVLERRYLRKGPDGRPVETIPQMFRRVARAIAEAEKELGGDPALWEERFYQLLTSLRFLPNSPTFTGAGTPLGQLAACFTPEMRVITEHGLKRIADLQPGDRVLTHRGRYQPVLQTSRRFYRGPLRIIKVRRIGQRIEATPEHPFLTPRGWVMAADLRPGDRVAIGFPKGILPTPSFDLAETLSGEDLEVQSTPTTIRVRRPAAYQNSGRQARWIPRHIPLSSEIARLCGYYVAEGTLGPDLEYVRFTFSIKEKEYHVDISNILSSILGFTPIMNSSRGNWVHIDLYNRALAQWFFAQFGRHSYNKRIPIWMQYANFDLQEEFLTGLFRGDGFYSEKAYLINGRKSTKLFRAFRLTLSNPTLIFQTWQILIRLGYEASIRGVDTTYVTPNAREAAQIIMPPLRSRRLIEKAFGIHLPDAGVSNNGVLRDEEHVYFEIENINEIYYEGYVYNCEVEEDHTYVVEGVVVHNCFVLPLEDDMGKIPGGIFQTLRDAALIQQTGGGNGFSFSRLRPKNAIVFSSMGRATGPVGFLRVYDRAFGEIAQGGCLTPDTLVFTEKGLLRLDEIVDPEQPGWHPHHLTVLTDEGPRLSPHGYNRGRSPVLRVVTREGLTLTGTPDHKVKVWTREGWVWRRLDELQPGDAIPVILGQHRGQLQTLQPVETRHGNQVAPRLPQVLDEELAFFLGYLTGDGFVAQSEDDHRVGVSVANDSYLIEEMPRLMERLFGVRVHVRRKPGDGSTIFVIDNRAVKEFLQINGLGKGRSTQACVPRLIRLSPPSVVAAYLRGLFEADGTIRHGYPELCTASERLAHEVAVLLIGLGCPAVVRRGRPAASRKGNSTPWRVHVVSPAGLRAWAERIGCDPRSRFRTCQEHTPDEKRGLHYPLPEPSYWLSPVLEAITLPPRDRRGRGKGLKLRSTQPPLRRTLLRYLRGDRQLTLSNYIRLSEQYPEFARHAPPVGDRWFVFVQSVEPAGEALTLDLEVEQNHTYLANGMVTHNSRRGANMAVLRVDHPDIEEFITCKTDENAITNFNISVGITDAFMRAVENDEEWELRFPDVLHPAYRNFRGTLEDAERAGIPIRVYKRVRARDLFRKIATQAHHNGEPGVLFLDTANRSNPVPHLYTLEATNPCGEQWLGPFENCCLGSVNLARHVKYVNGKAEVDWEKLRETVEWATRFLDNVVQVNQYVPAVPQLKEAAFKTRRIGLGFMGLADLMYHLRIRYGSEEGQEFAAQIAEFIRYHAMRTSIELARERGPFPAIRGSIYDPEDLKWEPPKPLKPYTRDWGRPPLDWNAIVEGIRRHGIRNAAQTTVAPTGCLVAGTMIITDRGLLPIEALGDPNGPQWQDVDWVVASEGGPRRATKFYVNGVAHTLRLVTRRGYVLQGTDGHRIRVWENGKWVWRRLDELKPGMRIPIVAGMIGTPQRVELDIPANKDPRCTDVRFPSHITPELAYLVGFFMGDGSLKQRSMRLSVSDPELKEELVRRIREVFGVEPRLLQDPRSRRLWSVEIHSKLLVEFWRKNGFNKIPARPGHRGKGYQPHVPIKILQTNDPRIYGAFLAGLLDADGMIQRGHLISWSTTCREFHDQVKAMLLALGVLTTSDVQQTGISGAPLYRLRTAHAEATRRLVQQLELLLRLRVPGSNGHVRRSYLRDTIPLSDWEKNSLLAIAGSTREQMRVWGWRQRGLANRETAIAFVQAHREDLLHTGLESFVQAVEQPVFYDEIVAIEDGGWRETYDLSVPGTHAYIANGFVSHNTISTVAGCEGYGCEPVFALAYIRYVHEAEGRLELRYVSPLFMRALKEAGLDEETRARIIEEVLRKGTCQHIQELPDWIRHTFVVAQDLTPEEHVWMQASIQAFIDNSISKTINFPETATVEDVEKAYLLAWKLGCKGLTVYVAGSRQKEVLETLETKARKEQKEAAMVPAQPTLPQPVGPTVRPRPQKLAGVTYRIATPVGTAFITLNENGEGQPFEVFLNVGKAGSDIAAVAEAIGRLISLLLRLPSPVPPAERLRQVVDQLQGIGGGRALGFGPERVRSLPDGIARVLAEYLAERGLELPAAPAPAVQPALPLSEPHPGREEPRAMGPVGDICPQCGEATLLEQEGCRTCYNCGYSEC